MPSGLFFGRTFFSIVYWGKNKNTKTLQVIWSVVKGISAIGSIKFHSYLFSMPSVSQVLPMKKLLCRRGIYEHCHLGCKILKGKMSTRKKACRWIFMAEPEISNYTLHKFNDNVILIIIWPDKITFLCTYVKTKGLK